LLFPDSLEVENNGGFFSLKFYFLCAFGSGVFHALLAAVVVVVVAAAVNLVVAFFIILLLIVRCAAIVNAREHGKKTAVNPAKNGQFIFFQTPCDRASKLWHRCVRSRVVWHSGQLASVGNVSKQNVSSVDEGEKLWSHCQPNVSP
jgi:hypothetical protein